MGDPHRAGRWVLAKAAWAGADFNTWGLRNAGGPRAGAPSAAPACGADLKGEALASVSAPSAGHLWHGPLSQGRALPPCPGRGSSASSPALLGELDTLGGNTNSPPQDREAANLQGIGGLLHFT